MDPDALTAIRNLIPDTDAVFDDATLFTDAQIEAFYLTGYSNIFWATGLAQMAVGNSELLIQKVITNYETSTNGAAVQAQWLKSAQMNIQLGQQQLANPYGDGALDYFDIEHGHDEPFSYGEVVELVGLVPWWIGN